MKRAFVFVAAVLCAGLLASCKNPFFVEASYLYEVTFVTNGGTSVAGVHTDTIKERPYTEKKDCTFAGWYTSSDFSGEVLSFPLELKENTTLYAKWIQMYTVCFETNGGSELVSYKTGLIESVPDVSRADYTLEGWYTTADFSDRVISFPYTVTKPTTLYAKWTATYSVSFETNGGSLLSGYRATEITSAPETVRDGYTFMGWYKDSACSERAEFPLTLLANTRLYAKWQQIFTVRFVTNGGSSVSSLQTGYIETAPVTTKTEASLEGGYTDADCSAGNKVSFPYTVTSDITLYAKWQAVQCTVTYYANGATSGTVPVSVSVDKGSSYMVLGNTGNLSKTGYAFTKWNTRADGNGQGYSAGTSITVTGNIVLYAQWGKDYAAMIFVEGGTFTQGSNADSTSNAYPAHSVTLDSFYIGQYELTYELWKEVKTWAASQETEWNLGTVKKGVTTNDSYTDWEPVTNISLYQAFVFCNAYSEMKGLEPCYYIANMVTSSTYTLGGIYTDYSQGHTSSQFVSWNKSKNGYRLPKESEWEYAAKGGLNQSAYTYAGSNTIGSVAWYSGNSSSETHPVGTKAANALDIYDMCGNVAEWCNTTKYTYSSDSQTNPNSWSLWGDEGRFYYPIYRGGSWYDSAISLVTRIYASSSEQTAGNSYIGVRLARNAE